QMHVVANGDDDATLVVADGAPFGLIAVLFVGAPGPNVLLTGDLHLVVNVVEGMEDLVAALQVLDGTIREDLAHAVHEVLPILGAMEIVHHEKTALEEILA